MEQALWFIVVRVACKMNDGPPSLGDGSMPRFLRRPYGRVDRDKLKRTLLQRCIDSGVLFHLDRVSGATHSGPTSKLQYFVKPNYQIAQMHKYC
jgi:hypothetical protein